MGLGVHGLDSEFLREALVIAASSLPQSTLSLRGLSHPPST